MNKIDKAISFYLRQNGLNPIDSGIVECEQKQNLQMFICDNLTDNAMSIVTYKTHNDVDDWDVSSVDNMHKEHEKFAMSTLNEYLSQNEYEYDATNMPDLQYHHIDIVPNEEDNALIRMHWNIQNFDAKATSQINAEEEKMYQDIALGKNLDKYQSLVEKFAQEQKEDSAIRMQKVIDTYLESNGYRNLDDWIKQNPDKCGLKENKRTKKDITNSVKLSANTPLQTKQSPIKDAR